MIEYIFWVDCLALAMVPMWFIAHEVYKDGVVGRLALASISFTAWTFIMELAVGEEYDMSAQFVLLITAFTLFLCWHLWRFETRVARENRQRRTASA